MRAMTTPCELRRGRSLSQLLSIDLRLALEIVERLLLLWQVGDGCVPVAALEEPLRGAGREHEQVVELELPRASLDLVHQRFAVTFAAEIRMHRERCELADSFIEECIQRGASDDHSIVLGDHE